LPHRKEFNGNETTARGISRNHRLFDETVRFTFGGSSSLSRVHIPLR
jgi:hypothetical protein